MRFRQVRGFSFNIVYRTDDQRIGVLTRVTWKTRAEEWMKFLLEATASERVDMTLGLHIVEGHRALLIVHKHPHLLGLLAQVEVEKDVSRSLVFTFPQSNSPVSFIRSQKNFPNPLAGLFSYS